MKHYLFFMALWAINLLAASAAHAHQSDTINARLHLADNKQFNLSLELDLLPLLAEQIGHREINSTALLQLESNPPEETLDQFYRQLEFGVIILANSKPVEISITRTSGEQLERLIKQFQKYGRSSHVRVLISGEIPPNTDTIGLTTPEYLGSVTLTTLRESTQLLPANAFNTQITLQAINSKNSSHFWPFLISGIEHIIPMGLDHILFILGLFFLSRNHKTLLIQITVFTLAHSCTLALASLSFVSIPSSIVEPLIALSIVWVALENLLVKKVYANRILVIFSFGLLHGLGFASMFLNSADFTQGLLVPLIAFNFGVEAGQLIIVAAAILATKPFKKPSQYQNLVSTPASVIIALTGAFWSIERLMS